MTPAQEDATAQCARFVIVKVTRLEDTTPAENTRSPLHPTLWGAEAGQRLQPSTILAGSEKAETRGQLKGWVGCKEVVVGEVENL